LQLVARRGLLPQTSDPSQAYNRVISGRGIRRSWRVLVIAVSKKKI
jgi:hypothetical protein